MIFKKSPIAKKVFLCHQFILRKITKRFDVQCETIHSDDKNELMASQNSDKF